MRKNLSCQLCFGDRLSKRRLASGHAQVTVNPADSIRRVGSVTAPYSGDLHQQEILHALTGLHACVGDFVSLHRCRLFNSVESPPTCLLAFPKQLSKVTQVCPPSTQAHAKSSQLSTTRRNLCQMSVKQLVKPANRWYSRFHAEWSGK